MAARRHNSAEPIAAIRDLSLLCELPFPIYEHIKTPRIAVFGNPITPKIGGTTKPSLSENLAPTKRVSPAIHCQATKQFTKLVVEEGQGDNWKALGETMESDTEAEPNIIQNFSNIISKS